MSLERSHFDADDPDFSRVMLPEGVSEEQWKAEMERWQNPRLRTLLGSLRKISIVTESNSAILNSSPKRLMAMWRVVQEVAERVREDLDPVLAEASAVPDLEIARAAVASSLAHLKLTLLAQVDDLPADPQPSQQDELRRFLCVCIGQLHAFLQDSFGSLMAADPRGRHDADYYLSKEFPRDVEESEWLYTSVISFHSDFKHVEAERRRLFPPFLEGVAGRQRIPEPKDWAPVESYLRFLSAEFTATLKKVLALRAIRLTELELLTHHANEIPITCRVLLEIYETGRQAVNALAFAQAKRSGAELGSPHAEVVSASVSGRLIPHIRGLDDSLRDLGAFIPIWRQGISQRRALAFRVARTADSNEVA
jgi:hypothetical protein